jgi:hypothetical protein
MEFKDYLKQQSKIKHENDSNRFQKYDAISEFYEKNPKKGYNDLNKETKGNSKILFEDKIKQLNSKGFIENKKATQVTASDEDFIVIDKLLKQWCWWENGYSMPFDKTNKDKTKDLYYYARQTRGMKIK